MIQAALISCWPLAATLTAVCVCLAITARLIKPEQQRPIFALHRDERGSVQSLSFVLTVPLFMMLMMVAVQLTQVMIGEIVVNYAAYAAARSASVWIPARVENPLELANWLNLRQLSGVDVNSNTVAVSPKMVQIHRAAALACLSIAPSRDLPSSVESGDAMPHAIQSAYSAYSSSFKTNSRLPKRLTNKWAYAADNTSIDITTFHRPFGTPQSGNQNEPPLWDLEPFTIDGYYKATELGWRDEVTVRVTHNFALLPGPGRLLARNASSSSTNPIQQNGSIYYVPLSASATIVPEGEKSIAPFVYLPFWP